MRENLGKSAYAALFALLVATLLSGCGTSSPAPVATQVPDTSAAGDADASASLDTTEDAGPVDAGPPPNPCGNGIVEGEEQCDPGGAGKAMELNGHTCKSLGYPKGELGCTSKCVIDKSDCSPRLFGDRCGGPFEDCGAGLTCVLFNEDGGEVGYCTKKCTADGHCKGPPTGASCAFTLQSGGKICGFTCSEADPTCPHGLGCRKASSGDYYYCTTDKAPECGDGVVDVGEECDGNASGGLSCLGHGYDGGDVTCSKGCKLDFSGCKGVHKCKDLPPASCTAGEAVCSKLELFEPFNGPSWKVTHGNKFSWLRHDTTMLVKHATARVHCAMPGAHPLGMGDMSMSNGGTPASNGQLRHPKNTHDHGRDIDIAYYQVGQANNHLRPVCAHVVGGKDQYHCVGDPNILDVPRTTLFIAALASSPRTRVIGVDGKIGPLLIAHAKELAAKGMLTKQEAASVSKRLAFETKNEGAGWYHFHHHHLHLSTYTTKYPGPPPPPPPEDRHASDEKSPEFQREFVRVQNRWVPRKAAPAILDLRHALQATPSFRQKPYKIPYTK